MRRKSERTTSSKKTKASPEKTEKKVEKPKRTRSRRKKQSTSSENETGDEKIPAPEPPVVAEVEPKPPTTPVKGESPEESQDQVWQVKTAGAGDMGEIQKLKICLTRPPSTPERAERSPRSKRKHSRATSSSDTPSVEAPEERKRSRHRSKRSHRESKDEPDKNLDSQGEEPETAADEISQSEAEKITDTPTTSENTISTSDDKKDENDQADSKTSDETKDEKEKVESSEDVSSKDDGNKDNDKSGNDEGAEKGDKPSDADTTVVSPKAETTAVLAPEEPEKSANEESQDIVSKLEQVSHSQSPARRRSMSVDKSEILELHPEESKCESDLETDKTKVSDREGNDTSKQNQVSDTGDKTPPQEKMLDNDKSNITGVVEKSKRTRKDSTDSRNVRKSSDRTDSETENSKKLSNTEESNEMQRSATNSEDNHKILERSDSIQSNHEELHNGQVEVASTPIVVSRKRRWGSRPSKTTTQKSITISTDVLKDIIPDVKPVEFEEIIEERKQKREVVEKVERPALPKIVIDNSENVEWNMDHRRPSVSDENVRDRDMKPKEPLASNRKISIIKDNNSIIARPPSPPRNKQSCVLFISNLVRPFTLPQLKNLLQRTGRLIENGFWIDKIKSKCYVIYENEDQAVETRHALHGVTWPVSNPKTLQVDFSTKEAFEKAKLNEVEDNAQVSTIPGTVEDWLREQDMKRERGDLEKPWERKVATREWDLGKNDKDKDKEKDKRREDRPMEKRRHRTPERSPEPARKFKKKEEEPPAKLLDDLFKKTKTTPCIYWLPLSAETIAIKEEQRRQHMAEHERRMAEQRHRSATRRH